jgi:peptide/nickel transport system substrate-binding protein
LKCGEVDIVYSIRGELAKELRSMPGLTLKPGGVAGPLLAYFADQWDPQSPWHDGFPEAGSPRGAGRRDGRSRSE